jgi:hypothetical protein
LVGRWGRESLGEWRREGETGTRTVPAATVEGNKVS